MHQLVIKSFQHCLMHGVTMKLLVNITSSSKRHWYKLCPTINGRWHLVRLQHFRNCVVKLLMTYLVARCDMNVTSWRFSFVLVLMCKVSAFWCRIHLWFRWMGGLHAKSMTSQRNRDVTRWRICVTMATLWQQQDGGYVLLWQRYSTSSTVQS